MERAAIVTMDKLGFSQEDIARWIGHGMRTVNLWISHFEQNGSVEDLPKSGRPRESTAEDDEQIVALAEREKFIPPKRIRSELELPLSARSVRRRLDEAGLFGRIPRISHLFKQETIEERFKFATDYGGFTDSDWNSVIFSDETHFILGGSGQIWVQRPEDEEYFPEYMIHRAQFPAKVSLWGAFTASGKRAIKFIEGSMNSQTLTDIFDEELLTLAAEAYGENEWNFLQDNAPVHRSDHTKQWLVQHDITAFKFPSYSPDMNPIENVWAQLKRRVEADFPKTAAKLKESILKRWEEIPANELAVLAHSMSDRFKEVREWKGYMTKY
jgi:transposase